MFNTKNIHIFLLPVKFLLKLFNDSTTNRLLLLIFVPERFGTHGMLHKKVHCQNYFKLFLHFLVELRKLYDFDG